MIRNILTLFVSLMSIAAVAQTDGPFNVTISNDEYKIYICMNLYDKDVTVPGADFLGQMDGYIGSSQGSSKWYITSSRLTSKSEAEIEVVNDYGSEDFTAVLKHNSDGTYAFRKKDGSTLKFAVKGKWQKLPGTLKLIKR